MTSYALEEFALEVPGRQATYGPRLERYPDPAQTYTKTTSETVWAPTETEPGHVERYAITTAGVETSIERYAGMEILAAAGMRRTFEQFGLRVSLSDKPHEDPQQSHVRLIQRSLSLGFPSHVQLKETVNEHAESVQGITLRIASALGEFKIADQLEELAKGRLTLSAEDCPDKPDLTYFWGSYFMHDMLEHFPGWLSLPPELLMKLQACAAEAIGAYKDSAPESPRISPATDRAITRLVDVATVLDRRLDTHSLGIFLTRNDPGFGKGMAFLLGGRASYYEKQLKEYIADHSDDDVLRIG